MDTGRISTRYAKAAYEYALEKGGEKSLYEEMKRLVKSFSEFPYLTQALEDPTISKSEKKKLLITAAGINVSDVFSNFVNIIFENNREKYIFSIALMYQEFYRKEQNIIIGELITAEPAIEEMKERLKDLLTKNTNKEVDFISKVNPAIIGGFVLKLESNQLDASVKNQLNKLKLQLIEMNKDVG